MKSILAPLSIPLNIRRYALALTLAGGLVLSYALYALATPADVPVNPLQQDFADAGKAYDEGRHLEAIQFYRRILDQGYVSTELLFNLGNAFFKSGQMAEAILFYRRAWYLAPRDPDLQANLRFALQTAGVTAPDPSLPVHFLQKLSFREWAILGCIAYWSAAAMFGLLLLLPRFQEGLRRALIVLLLLLGVSVTGVLQWLNLYRMPEVVIRAAGQKALSGPVADSVALFALPQGALARTKELRGRWTQIEYDHQAGWVPTTNASPVFTWESLRNASLPQ